MSIQDSPRRLPSMTSTVFQSRLPAVVYSRNFTCPMPLMPAGTEIRLRRMGTSRQKKQPYSLFFKPVCSILDVCSIEMKQSAGFSGSKTQKSFFV